MKMPDELRALTCDTIRMLAADAVQEADSGHPGTPMALADLSLVLWHEFLNFDPDDPHWAARDRFVLSCGHASMLLYSMLHLWGFDVSLDDLRAFRQWGSNTPGHPEVGHTAGVEVTTGPLGQGIANATGMALAAKMIAARLGDADFQPMSQRVFAICSDGDLMEGIAQEAASLAAHWRLDNLVWLYDDNKITIDGATDLAFSEDVGRRFEGTGWRVLRADGHDHDSVRAALEAATTPMGKPTLIVCATHIGFGSPNKVDTSDAHGSPLGDDELALTKKNLGWEAPGRFFVPDAVRAFFREAAHAKRAERASWNLRFAAWRTDHPDQAKTYDALWAGDVPADLWRTLVDATPAAGATRKTSAKAVQAAVDAVPGLVGGSADLTGSNGLNLAGVGTFGHPEMSATKVSYAGGQMHFGIREHGMGAITNGMLLHGGLRPFGGTFLVFSDYMRGSIRLAALSGLPNIFVFTHDSVFLGEDGPTHQPIEHHWALRTIPNLEYWRPGDGVEVAVAWAAALGRTNGPSAFALTRQGVPAIVRHNAFQADEILRGAYAVNQVAKPAVCLVGTGSELHLCVEAAAALAADGVEARVVSMPCHDRFAAWPRAEQDALLPPNVPTVTIEAGITGPWHAVAGRAGLCIGIDRFGASAPAEVLAEKFGLTPAAVTAKVRAFLAER